MRKTKIESRKYAACFLFMIPLSILIVAVLATIVSAETNIMRIDFMLTDEGEVNLINIKNSRGTFEVANFSAAHYIELVENNQTRYYLPFDESFYRLTDLPTIMNQKLVTKKLPFLGDIGTLNIYKNGELKLSYDLRKLCDFDTECAGYENEINCPYDCDPDYMSSLEKRITQLKLEEKERAELIKLEFEKAGKRAKQINFFIIMAIIGKVLLFTLFFILHKEIKFKK
ncbi:hypothetical protein KY325_04005 [Candidatus Woesearchaeota archaeon]|nr:hypothetical protein [Candidatus Woesearchaeota archaeon]